MHRFRHASADGGSFGSAFLGAEFGQLREIYGTDGRNRIKGSDGDDAIYGLGGNDIINGERGNDTIDGGDGSDRITSDGGVDSVDGGAGYDYWYGNYKGNASLGITLRADELELSNGTHVINTEQFLLLTGNGDDHLILRDDAARASIYLGGGSNSLEIDFSESASGTFFSYDGSESTGRELNITSFAAVTGLLSTFNDEFYLTNLGGIQPNTVNVDAGDGLDTLDLILASTEDFVFSVNADGSVSGTFGTLVNFERFSVTLGSGESVIRLGSYDDVAAPIDPRFTSGRAHLFGMGGNDVLSGGSGRDILDGGTGNDVLNGNGGKDTASYAEAAAGVQVDLAVTQPQATHGAGTDQLLSIENLVGSAFHDYLAGDRSANLLSGGEGGDVLMGRNGRDQYIGGGGADTIDLTDTDVWTDTVIYLSVTESKPDGVDVIEGFQSGIDRINLAAIDAVASTSKNNAFTFIGEAAFSQTAGELRYDQATGDLSGDVDGDGRADLLIHFALAAGEQGPVAADIML